MLSLKRITGRSGRGVGAGMHGLDSGLSGEWMTPVVTVAVSVTVLVLNGYYSSCYKRLFLPGFQGKSPASTTGRQARLKRIDDFFQSVTGVH
ncbi:MULTISPECIES: hypothetical protein [unclassified Pseudomonas]|uniref:hypothetical protein n=1 Tax=unclassified Pseudomonas TaxID=196821 RepID=UPI0020046F93|nr:MULTISPECIES: hypothetical protein [unclassified Pseudomonas]MCK6190712.1 hypothetical protein [Pseudomonas sp. EYE_354]WLH67644.1 hypothetical protein PSH59_21415 [Pseudomonas sp. FP2309]